MSSAVGKKETYTGDIVVSSCGAINSAALLLRSATDKHPHGLANGSDVVAGTTWGITTPCSSRSRARPIPRSSRRHSA